ncbi:hypothetical protein Agub_g2826, partial [Astrephomene gubernaculifera]
MQLAASLASASSGCLVARVQWLPSLRVAPRLQRSRLAHARTSMPTSEPAGTEAAALKPQMPADVPSTGVPADAEPIEQVESGDIHASKELFEELLDSSTFGTRGEGWLAAQLLAIL